MRSVLIISTFLLICANSLFAQKKYGPVTSIPFVDILHKIEKENNLTFAYDATAVLGYNISISNDVFSLQSILDHVFDQTRLTYEILDGQHILITPKIAHNTRAFLCGYILDKETLNPIQFSTVYSDDKIRGTETDKNGYFKIELNPTDRSIYIAYLGYKTLEITLDHNVNHDCVQYYLHAQNIEFETITLVEYLSDGISQSINGNTITLQPSEMQMLPGAVEQDIMSAIQFLPGILSADETLDGISVRGGTPDQNLILYDNIPMYHTSHFFGSLSAFNPYIIDQVDVYRSGIGSEYGGRVSSVIDITSKDDISINFDIAAGINLTHTYINTNIPLWKGSSIILSSRRSITDIWNTPTFIRYAEKVFQGTKADDADFNNNGVPFSDEFRFNDGNFKWMWEVGKNKFTLSSIGALNNLNYRTEIPELNAFSVDYLNLRNTGLDLAWERQWSDKFSSKIDITSSEYNYDYSLSYRLVSESNEPAPISFNTSNRIIDTGLNWTNSLLLNNGQKLKFGYQTTKNNIRLSVENRNNEITSEEGSLFKNNLHSLFGEYALDVSKLLHLDIGLRYQYSKEIRNNYFEPRISLITDVSEDFKLKISTSKHFQFVSQLVAFNINQLGLNNEIWVASNNKEIPVIESNQWMGGFIYKKDNWTLDLEGYVKELDGITTLTNNFVSLPEQPPFSIGKSRIRGIDVLVKRRIGRYRTWLAYTLSQSLYDFISLSSESVPATHDQTQVYQWVHTYQYGAWNFSLGWQRRSGLPFTKAESVGFKINEKGEEVPNIIYESVNSSRLKVYKKLDATVVYNFGDKSKLHGFIGFSIQNILNRNNIIGKQYLLDEASQTGLPEIIETDKLGLKMTPNISVNIRY